MPSDRMSISVLYQKSEVKKSFFSTSPNGLIKRNIFIHRVIEIQKTFVMMPILTRSDYKYMRYERLYTQASKAYISRSWTVLDREGEKNLFNLIDTLVYSNDILV